MGPSRSGDIVAELQQTTDSKSRRSPCPKRMADRSETTVRVDWFIGQLVKTEDR